MAPTRRAFLQTAAATLATPMLPGVVSPAAAAGLALGPRFSLAAGQPGAQDRFQLVARPGGGFISSWGRLLGAPYLAYFNSTGTPLGTPIPFPGLREPAVAAFPGGTAIAFYPSFDPDYDVVGQKLSAAMAKSGVPAAINVPSSDKTDSVFTCRLTNGNCMTAWLSENYNGKSVHVRVTTATGVTVGNETAAVPASTNNTGYPSVLFGITPLKAGGAMVTYEQLTKPAYTYSHRAQILSSAGARVGGPKVIRSTGFDNGSESTGIAPTASGGFVAVWQAPAGNGGQLKGRFYSALGAAGATFSTPLASYIFDHPSVAVAADGRFLVCNLGVKGTTPRTFAPYIWLFSPTGVKLAGGVALDAGGREGPYETALIRQTDGSFIAAWRDGTTMFTSSLKIYGRRITIT